MLNSYFNSKNKAVKHTIGGFFTGSISALLSLLTISNSMPVVLKTENQSLGQHHREHLSNSDWETLLAIQAWTIKSDERWAVVGGNDAQRSAICAYLREQFNQIQQLAEVSPIAQESCIAEEIKRSQTGIADEVNTGTLVKNFLYENYKAHSNTIDNLVETLQFSHCLNKRFRELSSGETRKALLIRALRQQQAVYLFQDPYEGLDKDTRPIARDLIEKSKEIHRDKSCSIFIASRTEQLPNTTSHLAYIHGRELKTLTINPDSSIEKEILTLKSIINPSPVITIPELPKDHPYNKVAPLDPTRALVAMRDTSVAYAAQDKPIFENLNFEIYPLQHCHIVGKNGAGKSTLLKLITGDHPQVYNNDIQICGFRRGGGESVWEVKRYIGYMGGEMLWNYRSSGQLAGKTLNVVISGLHDSIGLYTTADTADKACARAWLEVFEMGDVANKRFNKLSMAEQRLALIARALIKRPALLLLDEPCQGLDSVDRRRVLSLVEKLITAKACTVLYVSHHDDEKIVGINSEFSLDN